VYQLSEGHFWGEIDSTKTKLGGYIPQSLINVSNPFIGIAFHKEVKTSFKTIYETLSIPLEKENKIFVSFPNTARYVITAYIPQVITFYVLKLLNTPPLWMMYIARITTFLFWLMLIKYGTKKLTNLKDLFILLLLIPASMAINSTLNADVVSNGFLFIYFIYLFKFEKEKISTFDFLIISALILITTLNKVVYFPLIFLLLLIKKEQFGTLQKKVSFISILLISCLIVIKIFSSQIHALVYPIENNTTQTTYTDLREGYIVNPDLQVKQILNNPILFTKNIFRASVESINESSNSYIGGFGWESCLPVDFDNSYWFFLILFSLFCTIEISIWKRYFFISIGFAITILFLLSTHLHWDGVGDYIQTGWNGKYYIPIFPLYFFALMGLFWKLKEKYSFIPIVLNWSAMVLVIVIYIAFFTQIIQRYYQT
jgi:uncharacterized membrane protein